MKLLTVVGARPQFIKAGAVGYSIETAAHRGRRPIQSVLVNTGQHYDYEMSRVFFEELGLRAPDHDLNIGSGPHGAQTGKMLEAVERVIQAEEPDIVLVYGDTNSTLAGALAATKLHVPVAHVEAGLRSFNRRMPEEVNRVLTDHVSRWLFCPTNTAVENLAAEGIHAGVHAVGDVMYELVVRFAGARSVPAGLRALDLTAGQFVLATVHRAENTDDPARLRSIFGALATIAAELPVVVPLHPRTRKLIETLPENWPARLHIVTPLSYLEMVAMEGAAALIVTDSGGVQKEAYWLGVPCVTVRDETEWLETLDDDRNILCGADERRIALASRRQLGRDPLQRPAVSPANAGELILDILDRDLARQ